MKVAIVAQGQSWRGIRKAEVDEVWAINLIGLRMAHDLLFAMDDCHAQEARAKTNENVRALVEMLGVHPRFFTSKAYADYPGSVAFPLTAVINSIGTAYLNSTVAYAVAWAIHLGVHELHLYGVDFTYPNVHKAERGRACVEHLLGIAKERGMRIVLPEDTTLMDRNVPACEKPYGYDAFDVEVTEEYGVFHVELSDRELPGPEEMERRYA